MLTTPERGGLVIADISGYTAYLVGTEVDHAQDVLADLSRTIVDALAPPFTFNELEGDAAFVYLLGDELDPSVVFDTLSACYGAFRTRLASITSATTCQCNACVLIPRLDLKVVAHHGQFVRGRMVGAERLTGPDVILVHRLLKNGVLDATGWRAYALLSDACAERAGASHGWTRYVEAAVESFGDVACRVRDLAEITASRRAAQRVFVEDGDADFRFARTVPAAPAVVWQYWTDADKRSRWQTDLKSMTFDKNERGRMGAGAVGHCDHGSWASDMRYVDWRPFSYFTLERNTTKWSPMAAPRLTETLELAQISDESTELRYRMRAHSALGRLVIRVFGASVRRTFANQTDLMARAIAEDRSSVQSATPVATAN
jgi:uncharacterized protein YndB with AHSA1/START domain